MEFDRSKSLTELKRERFRNPQWDFDPFPTGFHLRRIAVGSLTPVELWILIRQGIRLDYVVGLALEVLEEEPLLRCAHADGDLFSSVLLADALVWARNPEFAERALRLWRVAAALLAKNQHPAARMLFADFRWFQKARHFLPKAG
jgi:hypothetical protein